MLDYVYDDGITIFNHTGSSNNTNTNNNNGSINGVDGCDPFPSPSESGI